MPNKPAKRYSIHPEKKKKKRVPLIEDHFLKRSFEWLKWRLIEAGDFNFHKPCLEK
jgi:hypothetical protein